MDNNEIKEELAKETVSEIPEEKTEETAETVTEEVETPTLSREEELEAEVEMLHDKVARTLAEFDNFKKRVAKERDELYSMGICMAVEKFIAVKDNLERAIPTMEGADTVAISDGVKMIDKQFSDVLSEIGVEAITAVGEPFDPAKHNAVMHDENEDFGENTVSEEFMKGYIYKNDRVIRHSMVKVSN